MRLLSRLALALCVAASAVAFSPVVTGQSSPIVGAWNMTAIPPYASSVYWLAVEEDNGELAGCFVSGVGNPVNLGVVKVKAGELIFQAGRPHRMTGPEFRAKLEGG